MLATCTASRGPEVSELDTGSCPPEARTLETGAGSASRDPRQRQIRLDGKARSCCCTLRSRGKEGHGKAEPGNSPPASGRRVKSCSPPNRCGGECDRGVPTR